MANGAISNPTLVENQAVAKAQTVGIITTFMGKGTQACDDDGKNCRSLFGADDSLDYTSVQLSGNSSSGIQAFSYLSGDSSADKMDSNTIASQTGTLVIACGDTKPKTVAGIAVRVNSCSVTLAGNAQISYQVCTGPSRGTPIVAPTNTMKCSSDPTALNFKPSPGYTCERPSCDSEPIGSLNGWSATQTVSYVQSVAQSGSDDDKAKNGLGFAFYPALGAGVTPSYTANSDNMVAVKVVQTALNSETHQSAVGLRIAFRHKALVTKEMMIQGASAIPKPEEHTAQWDTILKLQGNALIPQYQQKYAANGAECLQQINDGIATDGIVSVCDQQYTNENGVRPRALTAQVAAEGQNCGTTTQCLQEVVNTNTWEQTCSADVPLSIRKCTTKTDYDLEQLSWVRTKTSEQCYETRAVNTYNCRSYSEIDSCSQVSVISSGGIDLNNPSNDTAIKLVGMKDQFTAQYLLGTIADNYWPTGYYSREFYVDILDPEDVKTFNLYQIAYDDETAVSINGQWIWADFPGAAYDASQNRWGYWYDECRQWDDGGCATWGKAFMSFWERRTSWVNNPNIDFRPYLRAGRNYIRIDTGVVGGGESWAYFEISAWKMKCNTRVVNECTQFEQAK